MVGEVLEGGDRKSLLEQSLHVRRPVGGGRGNMVIYRRKGNAHVKARKHWHTPELSLCRGRIQRYLTADSGPSFIHRYILPSKCNDM